MLDTLFKFFSRKQKPAYQSGTNLLLILVLSVVIGAGIAYATLGFMKTFERVVNWVYFDWSETPSGRYTHKFDARNKLQFDFREDLESATLFGEVAEDGEQDKMAILFRGKFKKAPLLDSLQKKNAFKIIRAAGHELLTWRDGKEGEQETHYGAIVNEGLIAIGSSKQRLVQALNVLKGKAPALQPKQLGGLKLKKGNYFLAAVVNVKDLPIPPEAQAFNVQSIGFRLGEQGNNITAQLLLNSVNADSSLKIQQMLQGLLAMVQLQIAAADDPESKELAAGLQNLKIARQKNVVQVDLTFPVAKLLEQLNVNVQKREGDQPGKVELKFGIQGGEKNQDR